MLKMVTGLLVICFSVTMASQASAQCSRGYDNYCGYATSYVSSSNFNSCGSYYSSDFSYSPSSYGVAAKQYSSAPAVLPKPVFVNSASAKAGLIPAQSAPIVGSYSSSDDSYLPPVINPVRVAPIAPSSYSNYGSFSNYSQPTCAGGNCPYR